MNRKSVVIIATTTALAAGGVGAVAAIGSGDDGAGGATGPGAATATAAALKLVPGGSPNAGERDGENGATWEVEVRKPDGSTVDVRLDANYRKVVIESDSEGG